jgi:hypothetical protein
MMPERQIAQRDGEVGAHASLHDLEEGERPAAFGTLGQLEDRTEVGKIAKLYARAQGGEANAEFRRALSILQAAARGGSRKEAERLDRGDASGYAAASGGAAQRNIERGSAQDIGEAGASLVVEDAERIERDLYGNGALVLCAYGHDGKFAAGEGVAQELARELLASLDQALVAALADDARDDECSKGGQRQGGQGE